MHLLDRLELQRVLIAESLHPELLEVFQAQLGLASLLILLFALLLFLFRICLVDVVEVVDHQMCVLKTVTLGGLPLHLDFFLRVQVVVVGLRLSAPRSLLSSLLID